MLILMFINTAQITKGVYLGRQLGAGVQAKVFDLVGKDGSTTGMVLKLGHSEVSPKHFLKSVAPSMMNMQSEWELGLVLKAALQEPGADITPTLPGFTATSDSVVMIQDEKRGTATFQGLTMERINGWPISKRVLDPSFHNIHYIREMLFQVFGALDQAQRTLGFCHADMGLGNVMEHYPVVFPEVEEANRQANAEVLANADKVTLTCGSFKESPLIRTRSPSGRKRNSKEEINVQRTSQPSPLKNPRQVADFSFNSKGGTSLTPLGPDVEFKIIDYGVAELNEVLAQVAGGQDPEETLRYIQKLILRGSTPRSSAPGGMVAALAEETLSISAQRKIELVRSGDSKSSRLKKWNLLSVGTLEDNKFALELNPEMLQNTSSIKAAMLPKGPVERMYRKFWERKGDVYHLLLSLALALDDRVWPKEDEKDVQLFASLVHHVTGVKIRAYFASGKKKKRIMVMGKVHKGHNDRRGAASEIIYGARVRCFAAWRRTKLLIAAHLKPYNSGLLAGEALMAPFFRAKPPRAQPRVNVGAAFPEPPSDRASTAATSEVESQSPTNST